ncbi:hypothetical protein BGZ60DRAFT_106750 [Tricladium varicosporioides]|nr:hypothetical protein BGZ60DRAFT_106750 [Hymenoscyphus varicosporioides]
MSSPTISDNMQSTEGEAAAIAESNSQHKIIREIHHHHHYHYHNSPPPISQLGPVVSPSLPPQSTHSSLASPNQPPSLSLRDLNTDEARHTYRAQNTPVIQPQPPPPFQAHIPSPNQATSNPPSSLTPLQQINSQQRIPSYPPPSYGTVVKINGRPRRGQVNPRSSSNGDGNHNEEDGPTEFCMGMVLLFALACFVWLVVVLASGVGDMKGRLPWP